MSYSSLKPDKETQAKLIRELCQKLLDIADDVESGCAEIIDVNVSFDEDHDFKVFPMFGKQVLSGGNLTITSKIVVKNCM